MYEFEFIAFEEAGYTCNECGMSIPRNPGGVELQNGRILCRLCFQEHHIKLEKIARPKRGKAKPVKCIA